MDSNSTQFIQSSGFDVVILGAGGAGMMCAIHAARRGRKVILLDHAKKIGGKILISGGGRCNFTNTGATDQNYVSENPHFCKSALSRFTPQDFIAIVKEHNIPFEEKKLGQLFCQRTAQDIVNLLKKECEEAGAEIRLETQINAVTQKKTRAGASLFHITTQRNTFESASLVIATGGLSIPKLGATGLGHQIAQQFGLKMVETAPALDGFTFSDSAAKSLQALAGLSVDCTLQCHDASFRENVLFTHTGLSGPAALQGSLHWRRGDSISINLAPDTDLHEVFVRHKKSGNRSLVKNLLSEHIPARLAQKMCELYFPCEDPLPQISEKAIAAFCHQLHHWELRPTGTVGYNKAEVTRGGVSTDELSSKTLEAKKVPGLYFIGEVVDVTGWLGGYNFQWAWASGWAAGQVA
jgi:predicted Rossmann fold flavoprotein